MDFRRRPEPDEPDVQVIEDGPDHRRIFDAADDPHGALTFRAYQRIASRLVQRLMANETAGAMNPVPQFKLV
jgi:hypothetical protein